MWALSFYKKALNSFRSSNQGLCPFVYFFPNSHIAILVWSFLHQSYAFILGHCHTLRKCCCICYVLFLQRSKRIGRSYLELLPWQAQEWTIKTGHIIAEKQRDANERKRREQTHPSGTLSPSLCTSKHEDVKQLSIQPMAD